MHCSEGTTESLLETIVFYKLEEQGATNSD
jgi:hypothetical protein